MAQVTVRINGYAYTVGCEDGQEAHLQAMVDQVERRITTIRSLGGSSGESRMLVLASLLMADELHDLSAEVERLRAQAGGQPLQPSPAPTPAPDPVAAERLRQLADRAEAIAAELEQP